MVWRWNDSVWGTSFTTTTPNEACGTLRTRKLQRDSAAPCWSEDSEPACRSTVCEREACRSSLTAWTLPFFFFFFLPLLNWLRWGKPLFRHRGPFLFACLYEENGVWTFASEAFFGADRPESALCLTDWTTVQREESYFCSPSLCPFFFLGAMFSDRLESSWFCVRVCVCVRVCLSECVGVCIYISVRGCVARSWWQEAPFFLTRRREDNLRSFFANTLPPPPRVGSL